jgi:hypothetical protein
MLARSSLFEVVCTLGRNGFIRDEEDFSGDTKWRFWALPRAADVDIGCIRTVMLCHHKEFARAMTSSYI